MLAVAGAVESASDHPVAHAIARGAADRSRAPGSRPSRTSPATTASASGAWSSGRAVVVGRPAAARATGRSTCPPSSRRPLDAARSRAALPPCSSPGTAGPEASSPSPTPSRRRSAEAVAQLRRMGLTPVMLTGDHEAAARTVAEQVGIDEVIADVLPQEKAGVVRDLQARGRTVAMVGDGVNDAAALAQADLGLAMGTGSDVAKEASDLTLVRGDLRAAPDAIRLARRTLAVIRGNLFWAFAYNVAAIPLAATGLLSPMLAGADHGPVVGLRRDQHPAPAPFPAQPLTGAPAVRRSPRGSSRWAARPSARPVCRGRTPRTSPTCRRRPAPVRRRRR